MRFIKTIRFFCVVIIFFASLLLSMAGVHTAIKIPKGTIKGRLANGLSYIIKRNIHPQNVTELRLVMQIGALQQTENQGGTAHFIEHMAFAGSKSYRGFNMVHMLEKKGMKFGRDINAYTGFDKTIYSLSVPIRFDSTKDIHQLLGMMREWLDGLTFDPAYVEKERGIILEELKQYDTNDDFYKLKIGDNRYSRRMPLGTIDDIKAVSKTMLRKFYSKWYQPRFATVVVVGDINARKVERILKETFVSAINTNNIKLPTYSVSYKKGWNMRFSLSDLGKCNKLELIIPHEGIVERTIKNSVDKHLSKIVVDLLNNRLKDRNIRADCSDAWYLGDKNFFSVVFKEADNAALLHDITSFTNEWNTIIRNGFDHREFAASLKDRLASIKIEDVDKTSEQWCDDFVDYIIMHDIYPTRLRDIESVKKYLAFCTTRSAQRMLKEWLQASKKTVLACYTAPQDSGLTLENIKKAWRKGLSNDLLCYTYKSCKEPVESLMQTPPCLGVVSTFDSKEIKSERSYANIGVYDILLNNGIRILLRPTRDDSKTFFIEGLGRGGTADLPDSVYYQYESTAAFVEMGGIEKVNRDTLFNYLVQNGISLDTNISSYWHGFIGVAPVNKAQNLFNLIKEKVTAPEINKKEFDETVKEDLTSFGITTPLQEQLEHDKNRKIINIRDSIMGDAHSMLQRKRTIEDIKQLDIYKMVDYFKSLYNNTHNLTIVLTGDYDLQQMKEAAVGSFSKWQQKQQYTPPTVWRTMPKAPYRYKVSSANEQQLDLHFMLAGNFYPNLKTTLVLKLMRDIIQNRLLEVLRQRENITYSPFTDLLYHGQDGHNYYFDIMLTLDRGNVERAQKLLIKIIRSLQTKPISRAELQQLQLSFKATKARVLSDDATAAWRMDMVNKIKNCEMLSDFNSYDTILDSITPKNIQDGFVKYLNTDKFIIIGL
ncbi:peptidase M16 inactive domain protein [Prevotella amnii]|uniref:Peptidase M16 inactive domain protein n=1 Tax=Prevotella amnii TaxID=419005 RepID=A0A134B6W7_9BACT|nr:M16 family metallopeptidase [Prevotella amnii]KXB75664.1 peptidase M16 inactive domain protein [Prevotella amnii]